MATDLVMPVPRADSQTWHFPQASRPMHHRSHSYRGVGGPQISPLSISDASSNQANSNPPSPTGHYTHHGRPMYIPAVLRPCDEFPSRDIVRRKTGGSTSDSDSEPPLHRVNSNIMTFSGFGSLSHRLSRRKLCDTSTALEGDWHLDSFPEVTAPPTRRHWKPDPESSVCDDPTCKRNFSYFVRRHHCRKCGNIFCDWHSNFVLPLDQDANFNPRANPSRACNHCFQEVKASQSRHNSESSASTISDLPQQTPASPIMAAPPAGAMPTVPRGPDVAASVPRDWNWSTF
ncbi:hypothetical protein HIM_01782 [Hirsutella minnesotensis 3608]|nr:hypothetical protein HIM_01782 [Hirsutella minnesotensis 3608]